MGKRVGSRNSNESALTRWVRSVFGFVKFAEFEILFVLFFVIAFLVFKDLVSSLSLLIIHAFRFTYSRYILLYG